MKRVFRGRSYDTDKAERIAQDDDEILYRKKTGEYFLYKTGIDSSAAIAPLSYDEAREWADDHMSIFISCKYFFDIARKGTKAPLQLAFDKGVIELMKRVSVERGVTISELVEKLVWDEWGAPE